MGSERAQPEYTRGDECNGFWCPTIKSVGKVKSVVAETFSGFCDENRSSLPYSNEILPLVVVDSKVDGDSLHIDN